MFYLYTIFGPILIILFLFIIWKPNLKSFKSWNDNLLKTIPYLFTYCLFIYLIELIGLKDSSWELYSIIFILILSSVLLLIIKLIFYVFSHLKRN